MFVFVVLFLFVFILIINILSRPRRNIWLSMACLCLVAFYSALSLYYLKVGGFSSIQRMLFITGPLHTGYFEKLPLSFERLACILIASRLFFCYFFLLEGLVSFYRTKSAMKKHKALFLLPLLPIAVFFFLSFPSVFKRLFEYRHTAQTVFAVVVNIFVVAYLLAGLILVAVEYSQVQIMYLKRRFRSRAISYLLLGMQYAMFAMFEPITVYQNYGSIKLPNLFSYYSIKNKTGIWILFMCLFLASTLILIIQSIKYCHYDFDEKKKELVIEERINEAALSSSILVHGIKNYLLSSEIVINKLKNNEDVISNPGINEGVSNLSEINSFMLQRLNVLYRSFIKINTVLKIASSSEVFGLVREKLGQQAELVTYDVEEIKMLCDPDLLSEALCNIIKNALEAVSGNSGEKTVKVGVHNKRTKILMTIKDNGPGIPKEAARNIFDPFFSTKNSQTNWGLGLSYANMVIRKHRGSIQFETTEGKGTVFLIDLPRVDVR